MNSFDELYYLIGKIELLKMRELITFKDINFISEVLERNSYFHKGESEDDCLYRYWNPRYDINNLVDINIDE